MCTMGPSFPAGRPLPTVKMTPTILQSMVLTRTTLSKGRREGGREGGRVEWVRFYLFILNNNFPSFLRALPGQADPIQKRFNFRYPTPRCHRLDQHRQIRDEHIKKVEEEVGEEGPAENARAGCFLCYQT